MYIKPTLSISEVDDFLSETWLKYNIIQFHIILYDDSVFDILSKFVVQFKVDAFFYNFIDDYKIVCCLFVDFNKCKSSIIIRELRKALKGYSLFI